MRNYVSGSFQRVSESTPTCNGCTLIGQCYFNADTTITVEQESVCVYQPAGDCPVNQLSSTNELVFTVSDLELTFAVFEYVAGGHTSNLIYERCPNAPTIYRWRWAIALAHVPGYDAGNPPLYGPCRGDSFLWGYGLTGATHDDNGNANLDAQLKCETPYANYCDIICPGAECCFGWKYLEATVNTCCPQSASDSSPSPCACGGFRAYSAYCTIAP